MFDRPKIEPWDRDLSPPPAFGGGAAPTSDPDASCPWTRSPPASQGGSVHSNGVTMQEERGASATQLTGEGNAKGEGNTEPDAR